MTNQELALISRILKLSKLQINNVFTALHLAGGNLAEDEEAKLPALVLADLLEKIPFLLPEQRSLILSRVFEFVNASGGKLVEHPGTQIYFADGFFCTWQGKTGWLDLTEGEEIDSLPAAPVETIAYNLFVLVQQVKGKMEQLSAQENSDATSADVESESNAVGQP